MALRRGAVVGDGSAASPVGDGRPVLFAGTCPDNVRRTPGGGLVVLDWANSEPGEVNGELGCARFEYGLGQADRMRTLYAAYLAAGGPGRVADVET